MPEIGSFCSFLLHAVATPCRPRARDSALLPIDNTNDVAEIADDAPDAARQFDSRFALLLTAHAIEAQRARAIVQRERGDAVRATCCRCCRRRPSTVS